MIRKLPYPTFKAQRVLRRKLCEISILLLLITLILRYKDYMSYFSFCDVAYGRARRIANKSSLPSPTFKLSFVSLSFLSSKSFDHVIFA